jgi:uncharacterized protein YndB with AHSA1/START domain
MTSADRRADDGLGELHRTDRGWQVRFERWLPHSPDRVWHALTDPAELAAWFPTTIEFPAEHEGLPRPGARLTFRFRSGEGPDFTGSLIAYEPPRLLAFWWGDDLVRIELRAEGEGTALVLGDTTPERGSSARSAAGWHLCLDALAQTLSPDDSPAGDLPPKSWQPVLARYQDAFGPEASTIGPPTG